MTTPAPAPAPAPAPSLSSSSSVFCPQSLAIPITFPAFPPAAGDVHAFASPAVEKRVFTHRSAATATTTYASFSHASGSAARWRDDNEHLEFVGDMVLKGLTGMLIDELFPNADEGYMSALATVLLSNRFYAHLSRTLGLEARLKVRLQDCSGSGSVVSSERVLGGLFEAYVAGVYGEYGPARFAELYTWFSRWMRPYFVDISSQIAGGKESKRAAPQTGTISPVSRLHEFIDAHRLPRPTYRYARVEWSDLWACFVKLGDKEVGGTPMAKKQLAKGAACQAALEYLMDT